VDDPLGAAHEVEQRAGHVAEARPVAQVVHVMPCTSVAPASISRSGFT